MNSDYIEVAQYIGGGLGWKYTVADCMMDYLYSYLSSQKWLNIGTKSTVFNLFSKNISSKN
jgi:hypothetical protein